LDPVTLRPFFHVSSSRYSLALAALVHSSEVNPTFFAPDVLLMITYPYILCNFSSPPFLANKMSSLYFLSPCISFSSTVFQGFASMSFHITSFGGKLKLFLPGHSFSFSFIQSMPSWFFEPFSRSSVFAADFVSRSVGLRSQSTSTTPSPNHC
jgi:hypothetical protein